MVRIVLVCNGGISATIIMKKIRMEAEAMQMKIHIEATSLMNLALQKDIDVILLSPQISYAFKQIQTHNTLINHIMILNNFDYSSLNAKKIILDIRNMVEKEDSDEAGNS